MQNLGYEPVSESFLVKQFGNIQINITQRSGYVKSITGYDSNSEVVNIPAEVLQQVQTEIQNAL